MLRRLAGVLITTMALTGVLASAAAAQQPIGRDQHFVGQVNGKSNQATVEVVCAGPVWPGRTGPVVAHQTMSVMQVVSGGGYTGPFSRIYAWFVPANSSTRPTELTFAKYGAPQQIPTSVQVPCYGSGQVEFSSCPYLAPCADGWIPVYVSVQFADIAA